MDPKIKNSPYQELLDAMCDRDDFVYSHLKEGRLSLSPEDAELFRKLQKRNFEAIRAYVEYRRYHEE